MIGNERTTRERVVAALDSLGRVEEHAGEDSPEGIRSDLTNLRAAVRELQQVVVILAEELDRRG